MSSEIPPLTFRESVCIVDEDYFEQWLKLLAEARGYYTNLLPFKPFLEIPESLIISEDFTKLELLRVHTINHPFMIKKHFEVIKEGGIIKLYLGAITMI